MVALECGETQAVFSDLLQKWQIIVNFSHGAMQNFNGKIPQIIHPIDFNGYEITDILVLGKLMIFLQGVIERWKDILMNLLLIFPSYFFLMNVALGLHFLSRIRSAVKSSVGLLSNFFQNEEIFVELDELDEFYRITHSWIGSNYFTDHLIRQELWKNSIISLFVFAVGVKMMLDTNQPGSNFIYCIREGVKLRKLNCFMCPISRNILLMNDCRWQ